MEKQPRNLCEIQKSFTIQAENFENPNMNFSKQEYLDYTVTSIRLSPADNVLETAAGTCACGRSMAPFVNSVVCLDATQAMLDVGRREALSSGLLNMRFLLGIVEQLPFEDETFDVVISRLAFHHFEEIDRPFAQMARVLKKGGKLVIIDMEAAAEPLRVIEDAIETMRDPSHMRNRSRAELLDLYDKHGIAVVKNEITQLPVSLDAWMALTDTPPDVCQKIRALMDGELSGGDKTGFEPCVENGSIRFSQRWLLLIGQK